MPPESQLSSILPIMWQTWRQCSVRGNTWHSRETGLPGSARNAAGAFFAKLRQMGSTAGVLLKSHWGQKPAMSILGILRAFSPGC